MKKAKSVLIAVIAAVCGCLQATAENTIHIVLRGETLESIAQKYGISVKTLTEMNPDAASFIYAGQELTIPESTQASAPSPSKLQTSHASQTIAAEEQTPVYTSISRITADNDDSELIGHGTNSKVPSLYQIFATWTGASLDNGMYGVSLRALYNSGAGVIGNFLFNSGIKKGINEYTFDFGVMYAYAFNPHIMIDGQFRLGYYDASKKKKEVFPSHGTVIAGSELIVTYAGLNLGLMFDYRMQYAKKFLEFAPGVQFSIGISF